MFEIVISCEQSSICPKCGAFLYQEVWECEHKIYVSCNKKGCGYENSVSYDYLDFTFIYRDEFMTKITAKSLEDALKKLDDVSWNRTGNELWQEYLSVEYYPVFKA